jgi:AcrR family transcriptional regulator
MATQTRSIRTRRTAVHSIARLIAERGYSGTRVADIVEVAGLTKGALYFHFPSKYAAAGALLDAAAERYEFLEGHRPTSDSRAQSALELLSDYTDRVRADVILQAESVLWSDPSFADRARAGVGYVSLRDRLTELTTPQLADALMAIILGITATPGRSRGLATSGAATQLNSLAVAVLDGLDHTVPHPNNCRNHTEARGHGI